MIGVLLWKDPAGRKAVVWCEDHASLAFISGSGESPCPELVEVGDMIRFDLRIENNTRYVANPVLIQSQGGADLPRMLADTIVPLDKKNARSKGGTPSRPAGELVRLGAA